MEYRNLGRSGLKVSPLCLGTMMFGGPTDEPGPRMVAQAKDAGVNFIDTADVYSDGRSEEIVGRAIKAERDHWVLATKMCNAMGPGPNQRGLSRRWMFQACDASLARLGTDWIDIMYLHEEDRGTPLEETVIAIADLIRAGKLRYFGVSNYRSWRLAEICNICDRLRIDRPVVSQPYYNAMNRMPGSSTCRPAATTVSGWCRTAARPRRAHRQVRSRPAAAERHPPAVRTCA